MKHETTVVLVLKFLLTAMAVGIWAYVQWYLLHKAVIEVNRDLLMRALGLLDAALLMTLGHWFQSSIGSEQKTRLLAKAPPVQE